MKKIATKVITISSIVLIVSIFIIGIFYKKNINDKKLVINNNNLNKMADKTSILFKEEDMENTEVDESIVEDFKEEEKVEEIVEEVAVQETTKSSYENEIITSYLSDPVITTYVGNLTGYGPDCYGCTSGKTSTGHNLYESIYYEDSEYGTVRILAGDYDIPFYSIIRISNVPGMDPFLGIVLDRGGNVGFPEKGKGTMFDLAFASEKDPNLIGLTHNVTFELLRSGE